MSGANSLYIPRRATARLVDGRSAPMPLSEWRSESAYVLLADPGAGKTDAFKTEAAATGASYVTARDFVSLRSSVPVSATTLFIDALDEMRAGSSAPSEPLDAVRRRLDELGRPRFRIACREADWIGAVDADAMRAVSPNGELVELRLEPLSESEIRMLLRHWRERVPNADAFWDEAERQHITALLANPLILDLMVDAARNGALPETRSETYRLACERLASERNQKHRAARRSASVTTAELREDAASLCAMLLLAGAQALTCESVGADLTDVPVESLPKEFGVRFAEAALASKLFVADGERRLPRHRTVAEYLGATALAHRISDGLPIGRVLALIQGFDGGIVEPLRGLHAWLAAHCPSERSTLIDRDPLGVVLYGDVRRFESREKRQILEALGREAQRFAWFRNGDWAASPFGALGTADMIPTFSALLQASDRSPAQQALLDCVLDAVLYGEALTELKPALELVVRDSSYRDDIRGSALHAWLAQSRPDPAPARAWLDDILNGAIDDPRDELTGALLDALYPEHVSPAQVMRYFHVPKAGNFVGTYRLFWDVYLIPRTPADSRALLADQFAELLIDRSNMNADVHLPGIVGKLIASALEASGERAAAPRIHRWLQTGLDEYGFAALKGEDGEEVRNWLSANPTVQKSVLAYAFATVQPDPKDGQLYFWPCEQLLYQAQRPEDWFRWLLEQATGANSEALARYCFDTSAHAAIQASLDYGITMEDVESWVGRNRTRWPHASDWLADAWSLPLDHWQAKHQRRNREYEEKQLKDRERRYLDLAKYSDAIRSGTAPAGLMHQIALAYRGRFSDIHGETPEARIQDLLGGSVESVANALAGLRASLWRSDLPTVAEILKSGMEQHEHYIRPACLVGAELVDEREPNALDGWSDDLLSRLVAFWFTDGTGETPHWYRRAAKSRPAPVAAVMREYAKQCLRKRPDQSITGLWSLAHDDEQREFGRAVLPELLLSVPARANEAQLRRLNQELLPAAVRHLERGELSEIVSQRLALKSLDAGQRIAWLVAALAFDADSRSRELIEFMGNSQSRAAQLSTALVSQFDRQTNLTELPASVLARLIALMAPHALPEYPSGSFMVGDADRRRDLVHSFIRRLSASQDDLAASELSTLRAMPALKHWAMALDAGKSENARIVRAARFMHAGAEAVALTLANRKPANASDLSALALDHLRVIGSHIRDDDSNSVQLFWREDSEGRLVPKVENACRDVLLDKLRDPLLRLSVQTEKEASAANDTRADLRVSAVASNRRIVVPIEIKKESHEALWTAWRDQLDGRYATDPAAQGIGIYLVLWFGHRPRSSPQGDRPRSAGELQALLRDQIPVGDRIRLTVLVLDLSQPGATTAPRAPRSSRAT